MEQEDDPTRDVRSLEPLTHEISKTAVINDLGAGVQLINEGDYRSSEAFFLLDGKLCVKNPDITCRAT